jgi:hypothetical protein
MPSWPLIGLTMPSRLFPRQALPHQKLKIFPLPFSPCPRPAVTACIVFPRASMRFKPGLNDKSGRPLSFATFHMFISLFVVELCSS